MQTTNVGNHRNDLSGYEVSAIFWVLGNLVGQYSLVGSQ